MRLDLLSRIVMPDRASLPGRKLIGVAILVALPAWSAPAGPLDLTLSPGLPPAGGEGAVSGRAQAVQATALQVLGGTTIVLADTGTLTAAGDARQASQLTGEAYNLLGGETLHAATIGSTDQVVSEASLTSLSLNIAGNTVGADLVMAEALARAGSASLGATTVDGLVINGIPISVSGSPNQTVPIPGGHVTINEQTTSPGSAVVKALHVVVYGVADVVIGSASAAVE